MTAVKSVSCQNTFSRWSFFFWIQSFARFLIALMGYGGHHHCAATDCHDGRSSRRGDVVGATRLKFHVFPKDQESLRLWVSRVNREDLPVTAVSKHTVLCSLHFHQGKRTAEQPHPVHFAHRTYPLCRKKSTRSSQSTPAETAPPTKRRKCVFNPCSLSFLALCVSERRIADLELQVRHKNTTICPKTMPSRSQSTPDPLNPPCSPGSP